MLVSAGLPTCMEGMMYPIPFASPDDLVRITRHAETLGYHSVWGNDHMTTQRYVREEFEDPPNFWEPLITYAHLAAHTSKIRFGTGLLITPMRKDIVVAAKQIATLDHLSRGRFILALGVGAYREEFEALHPGWKANRGEMLDESVQVLHKLFKERTVSWDGIYYQIQQVEMYPKPYQTEIPIYFGGNNNNALRRTALFGNGWLPAGMPIEQLKTKVAFLRERVEEHGKNFCDIDIAMQLIVSIGRTHESALERFQKSQMYKHLLSLNRSTLREQVNSKPEDINLIGTAAEVIEKAKQLGEAGVKHLCGLYFCAENVAELMDQMQIFAEDVMPSLKER